MRKTEEPRNTLQSGSRIVRWVGGIGLCACLLCAVGCAVGFGFVGEAQARYRPLSLMRLVYRIRTGSAGFQRATAREIRRQGEVRAWPVIAGLLWMSEASMRRGGAIALGEMGIPWTAVLLRPFVKDPNVEVRMAAIASLGMLRDLGASTALLEVAAQASRGEAILALASLAQIGDAKARATLEGWTPALQGRVGMAYSLALASLGHAGRQARWEAFWKRSPQKALSHLMRWRSAWASTFLFARFQDTPAMRLVIAKGLLQYKDRKHSRFLEEACEKNTLPSAFCEGALRRYQAEILPKMPAIPPSLFAMEREDVARWLEELHKQYRDPTERFVAITQRMLGTKYVFDALGEGPKGRVDQDPIFSFARMDCVTFLEQAMAMNQHPRLRDAVAFAQRLRYVGGQIAYAKRKHFPMLQWIPMMIRDGFVEDITRKLGGERTRTVTKQISLQSYQSSREGRLMLERLGMENLVMGQHSLPYLPLDVAVRQAQKMKTGTIISVLVPMPATSPFQIVHQGVVVWSKGRPYMRHATKVWNSVMDMPLVEYLQSLRRYRKPRLGVHLLQIRMVLPPHLSRVTP